MNPGFSHYIIMAASSVIGLPPSASWRLWWSVFNDRSTHIRHLTNTPLPRVGFRIARMPDNRRAGRRIRPIVTDYRKNALVVATAEGETGSEQGLNEVAEIVNAHFLFPASPGFIGRQINLALC